MYQKKAFTLVELIVGVTISMLLMVSVGALVTGGMENILKQQKLMEKNAELNTSMAGFYNGFQDFESVEYQSGSGYLFRRKQDTTLGGFSYLGTLSLDNKFCSTQSGVGNLNYLTLKNFIVHEEIGEDIFDNFEETQQSSFIDGSDNYTVDSLQHQVLKNGERIIGGKTFGHTLFNGENGRKTRLNNPTALAPAEGGFFLSDTLNHRILFYKDDNIYLILDKNDGINQPTGLAYDSYNSRLYISNSGNSEILVLESPQYTQNPDLVINFDADNNYGSFDRINISFPDITQQITGPTQTGSFVFQSSNFQQNTDYIRIQGTNQLEYYFRDFNQSSTLVNNGTIASCNSQENYIYDAVNKDVSKEVISCLSSQTGSIYRYSGGPNLSILSGENYSLEVKDINPSFNESKNYIANISFYDGNNEVFSKNIPYFLQGDGIINNMQNMTLRVFTDNVEYPTGLEITGTSLRVNDFLTRKQYDFDINTTNRSENTNLREFSPQNFEKITYIGSTDTILNNPISQLQIEYDSTDQYLGINIGYYQYLDCYNPDDKIEKHILLGKNLQ